MNECNFDFSPIHFTFIEWCQVLCLEDNKKHLLSSDKLETDERQFITDDDLKIGSKVVWNYKGIPYSVQILHVFSEFVLCPIFVYFHMHKQYNNINILLLQMKSQCLKHSKKQSQSQIQRQNTWKTAAAQVRKKMMMMMSLQSARNHITKR